MADTLDKWQEREAREYAEANKVSYGAAVKELFPPEVDDEPAAPVTEDKSDAKVPAGKTRS